ncbi:MAG: tRNA dimethylallyltransferase [Paracoccaceae bacterium]|jgi:tRNA dimethylallyltransferase
MDLSWIDRDRPVLIAGPTASGKSALAMHIAARHGGVIINADALQVFGNWRLLTARPSLADEAALPHALYGHVARDQIYSTGHWLRDVAPLLAGPLRPIIVGGTGLNFAALTQGLAQIPAVPAEIRERADDMSLAALLDALDPATRNSLDVANRARVQRAFEVATATGRPLRDWQSNTGPALLPLDQAQGVVVNAPRDWLVGRIGQRFDMMIANGALDEVSRNLAGHDPVWPSSKAIGVPDLIRHLNGACTLAAAREGAIIATRQYAKRQRTWFRARMADWRAIDGTTLS